MADISVDYEILSRLRVLAREKGTTPEELAEQAIRQLLREESRRILLQEAQAYRLLHAELLRDFPEQFVAIHQGRVVDRDADQLSLLKRIEEGFPEVPVLITQVLSEPEEVYKFRSPRIEDK